MAEQKKKVGIMGSAFDPLHVGHVAMTHIALNETPLDEIWLVPCPIRYDKTPNTTDSIRLKMCQVMSEDLKSKGFPVSYSDVELKFSEFMGTYYLLKHLTHIHSNCSFTLIMGEDSWNSLHTWKNPSTEQQTGQQLLNEFDTVIFPRKQSKIITTHSLTSNRSLFMKPLNNYDNLTKLDINKEKAFEVSSTLIRQLCKDKSYDHLKSYLPECILNFVIENNLYGEK